VSEEVVVDWIGQQEFEHVKVALQAESRNHRHGLQTLSNLPIPSAPERTRA
jgi:hypothetical protein